MYPKKLSDLPKSIQKRASIERRIVSRLVRELTSEHNLWVRVDDGERLHPMTNVPSVALNALIETDEDYLRVYDAEKKHIGTVRLVYGNDGWDVMSDWHESLNPYIPHTIALVDSLQ